ncbi:copper resistance protein NlpE N-terminal domain-containing protein [Carnimonas nigrificans]|uniref:copper resistance protein NlpE N-terminal domain-containing protein n=1 Tax=Carnimonas nigrificans TaxID=64323 RepID=UPI0004726F08|nr:copper resistance protein NlpE N-terminal domain-containing protein [Carnimonas nigrificans]
MMLRNLTVTAAVALLLAGCVGHQENDGSDQQAIQKNETSAPETETFKGTFPCRSCTGIDTTLTLEGDNSTASVADHVFTMEASYKNHPQNPPDEHYEGSWGALSGTPENKSAKVIQLTPSQGNDQREYYFLRVDENTLELIKPDLHRFENGNALRLKRQ